jgi:molybdate transport system ATP-binding protein
MTSPSPALQTASTADSIELSLRLKRADFDLNVSFSLPAHGTTVLFGPSGGGKTSILRAIAGLEPEVQGDVRVKGCTWQSANVFVPPHARRVGFVFQHSALLPHLSVEQNLRYGFTRVQGTELEYRECVEQLDLQALMHRKIAQLSGGERQRVAMGRALLTRPEVLLMDEPLAALDAGRRTEVLGYLERLKKITPIPMIYVTHSVDEMSRLADYLVLMKDGRVRQVGPALEVMNSPDVPLALRDDAGVVVVAYVSRVDNHGLCMLSSDLGELCAQGVDHHVGDRVRLRIHARDVSLSLSEHRDTSVLNIMQVTVKSLRQIVSGQVLIELGAGENQNQTLLARISHTSAERLTIKVGLHVWAQIKAVALLA